MKNTFYTILFIFVIANINISAQNETLTARCSNFFTDEFISDGQHYSAKLKDQEPASFQTTFFSGNTYRLAIDTDIKGVDLIFELFDNEKNLLFSNSEHQLTSYWDFKFNSTIDCVVEVKVRSDKKFNQGLIILLIGFKANKK